MTEKRLTYTPLEFAKLFNKSQSWAYRQLYAGRIAGITEYGRVMIAASEVDKILNASGRYLGAQTKSPAEAKAKAALKIAKEKRESTDFKSWVERRRSKYQEPSRTRISGRNWSQSRKNSGNH